MFCVKCGKNIEDGSKFCGFCGAASVVNPDFTAPSADAPMNTPPVEMPLNIPSYTPYAPPPSPMPPKKKIKISFKKVIAVILLLTLIGGMIGFAVTYESADKALENIVEGALFGDDEDLDKYYIPFLTVKLLGFSKGFEEEVTEGYEGDLHSALEYNITSQFNSYFEDDDYDIDWKLVSKKDLDLDDELFENADIMKNMIEQGYLSSVFHPIILLYAVEYEIKVTAQEKDERKSENFKIVLVNYNMKWYFYNIAVVD